MKKGEVQQVFVYLMVVVVAGVVILIGYSSISNIIDSGADVREAQLRSSLESEFGRVTFGSFRTVDLSVPSGIDSLCFVDSMGVVDQEDHPFIYEELQAGTDNTVFLVKGDSYVPFLAVDDLVVSNEVFCANVSRGTASFVLTGLGRDRVGVGAERVPPVNVHFRGFTEESAEFSVTMDVNDRVQFSLPGDAPYVIRLFDFTEDSATFIVRDLGSGNYFGPHTILEGEEWYIDEISLVIELDSISSATITVRSEKGFEPGEVVDSCRGVVDETVPGRVVVSFENEEYGWIASYSLERLNRGSWDGWGRSDVGAHFLGPVSASIPEGEYRVTLYTYDGHGERTDQDQRDERWFIRLMSGDDELVASRASNDLPVGYGYVFQADVVDDSLYVPGGVNNAFAWHAAYPDDTSPNSLHPLCAVFDPVNDDMPPVDEPEDEREPEEDDKEDDDVPDDEVLRDLGAMSTMLFYPYVDFVIEDVSYDGNPFDVIVDVVFTHTSSGEEIRSLAFYDGDWDENTGSSSIDDWVIRFTGTRLGEWTFVTSSSNSNLNGYTGTIDVVEQDNLLIHGGKRHQGNWWTILDYQGNEKPFIPIIYHHEENSLKVYVTSFSDNHIARESQIDYLVQIMEDNHANVAVLGVFAAWTDKDSRDYGLYWSDNPQENPQNPDIRSFEVIEHVAARLAEEGIELHLWKWRDEDHPDFATPAHIGGVNSEQDRRVQRYIAARLGPLLNWHMTYGIDMHEEWATPQEVLDWYDYMHEHLGWSHHLSVRERLFDQSSGTFVMGENKLDYHSDDHKAGLESDMYEVTAGFVDAPPGLPFVYERRFLHTRDDIWDMNNTRRAMWQFWMAGGATAVWGRMWGDNTPHYPNPEQIGIFRSFWENYMDLDYERDNAFTDGYGLSSLDAGAQRLVAYKENTNSVQVDLSGVHSIEKAIAVNTKSASYSEIDISGSLSPGEANTWTAPINSDWVLYVKVN